MKDKISTGIIGFGLSGRYFFAPFLSAHQGFTLKAILTSQNDEVGRLYPQAVVYSHVDELLNDIAIQLVIVASPNYTHFEIANKALLAGKHVVIEKPFTVTSKEAEELIGLAKQQQKKLVPFQNRRWDGDFLTVKKLIEEGTLGEVLEFESHFDRYRPDSERVAWKNEFHPGVGTLYDLGPHLIDQALCLFGRPEWIYGDIRKHRPHGENPDSFEIQLHYPITKVILKAGVMCREVGPRFIVHGRKGSFIKYGLDVQEQNLKDGILPGNPELGKDIEANYGLLHVEDMCEVKRTRLCTEDGNYMEYFDNIYNAITANEGLKVTPYDGKLIIEVIEKAKQSSNEKRLLPIYAP
jgi:scyllo-inositol 2-dehydrogenase (NADP+)